jgi:hypothetical protein
MEKRLCNLFSRLTGKSAYKQFPNTAVALVSGASLQFDEGGNVAVGAANKQIIGVSVNAQALSTVGNADIVDDGSIWKATGCTGTMTAAKIGATCDILAGGLTLDLGTDSSHDVTLVGWDGSTTNVAYFVWNQGGLSRHVVGVA